MRVVANDRNPLDQPYPTAPVPRVCHRLQRRRRSSQRQLGHRPKDTSLGMNRAQTNTISIPRGKCPLRKRSKGMSSKESVRLRIIVISSISKTDLATSTISDNNKLPTNLRHNALTNDYSNERHRKGEVMLRLERDAGAWVISLTRAEFQRAQDMYCSIWISLSRGLCGTRALHSPHRL